MAVTAPWDGALPSSRETVQSEPAPAFTRSAPAISPYFVSLPVDFLLIGGASIALFLILPYFYDGPMTGRMLTLNLWLTWIGNWPHQSATNYRLYSSKRAMLQYPFTSFAVPLLILLGVVGSFLAPAQVAPVFIKLALFWVLYHYTGQTIGVSLLYARRAGRAPAPTERLLLVGFLYGTFFSRSLWSETSSQALRYFGVAYPRFGVPMGWAYAAAAWTYACAFGFLLVLGSRCWRERRWPPVMYLLPSVTQYVWFFVIATHPGYVEFVPFFHGLQYLTIAWAMQLKERADLTGAVVTHRYIWGETARWYLLNVVGGAALFYVIPRVVAHTTGINEMFARAVMFTAFQLHHSLVDGVIWKLRSASVVSPLLVNVRELVVRSRASSAEVHGALA
jgi:hypothetical protein